MQGRVEPSKELLGQELKQRLDQHMLLLVDNMMAIAHLNHQGRTISKKLSDLAIEIWKWALERRLTLHAEDIPEVLNGIPRIPVTGSLPRRFSGS